MKGRAALLSLLLGCVAATAPVASVPAATFDPAVLESVVSVLPDWPGYPKGGGQAPPGTAPEGTAVAVAPGGYLATALHVVARAQGIEVRLADGRRLPARLVGGDAPTDLALLKVEADLPPLPPAPEPALGAEVCAVGNAFGLGLSVSCGVVSALHRSNAGFNRIEDFVQTDAAINPGASGGALVDAEGRLVGLLSAIFAKDSGTNIGVNFAVSWPLLDRVVDDLIAYGRVARPALGFRAGRSDDPGRLGLPVVEVAPDGAAARAGLEVGDRLLAVGARRPADLDELTAALALLRPGEVATLLVERDAARQHLRLLVPQR